ncbi:hypothetical protein ACFLYS_02660 [Chloroflexota bacterium]
MTDLQGCVCCDAYLDLDLARRWELLGIATVQGYGTTEASPVVAVNPLHKREFPFTKGCYCKSLP